MFGNTQGGTAVRARSLSCSGGWTTSGTCLPAPTAFSYHRSRLQASLRGAEAYTQREADASGEEKRIDLRELQGTVGDGREIRGRGVIGGEAAPAGESDDVHVCYSWCSQVSTSYNRCPAPLDTIETNSTSPSTKNTKLNVGGSLRSWHQSWLAFHSRGSMKGVLSDMRSRALYQQRRGLVSESQERILPAHMQIRQLSHLAKSPAYVHCPFCRKNVQTKIRQSDSRSTRKVNFLLLTAGLGDPFALTSFDWCQNIDHFCPRCRAHLARKPYKGDTIAVAEASTLELPLSGIQETTEHPAETNSILDLYGDPSGRMQSSAAPGWESYQPSLIGEDEAVPELPVHTQGPFELAKGRSRPAAPAELAGDFSQPSRGSEDDAVPELPVQRAQSLGELAMGSSRPTAELPSSIHEQAQAVELESGRISRNAP